jgi:hypothetical protein
VTDRELIANARSALHEMDDERSLRRNPLLTYLDRHALGHDRLRAHVLRALERLDPGSRADLASERRGRQHTILLRCDVQRKTHQAVAASLGLSRRQFYRDRRLALIAFAAALREYRGTPAPVTTEPRDVRLLYIKTLRERGKYDAVWRESVRALHDLRGDPREAEVWTVAAEAARFFGNARKSQEAIDALRAIAERAEHPHLRRATALRTAICETALDWMQADFAKARSRVERVVRSRTNDLRPRRDAVRNPPQLRRVDGDRCGRLGGRNGIHASQRAHRRAFRGRIRVELPAPFAWALGPSM